jgi:nucleoside-diphosphate-sugar epimerase
MPHAQLTAPQRAVVTGSAGFIGSHLAQALLDAGTTAIGVDRRDHNDPSAAANLAPLLDRPTYLHVTADLLACAIESLLLGADTVFHLAGVPGVRPSWGPEFSDYVSSNILATQRLMTAATTMRVPRLVVASSSSVYGRTDGAPTCSSTAP